MRKLILLILLTAAIAQPSLNIQIPPKFGAGITNEIKIEYNTDQSADIAVLLPTDFVVDDWTSTSKEFEYKERFYAGEMWKIYKWRVVGKGEIEMQVVPNKTGEYKILVITTYFLGFDQKEYDVSVVPPGEIKPVCGNGICEVGEIFSCPTDCIRVEKMTAIYVTLSIICAVISGVLYYYAREYMKKNLLMYLQLLNRIGGGAKLYEFVKKARALGLDEDEIRRKLVLAGWNPVAITYALKATRKPSFLWMLKYYLLKAFRR